jgi:hypothetical protein
MIPRHQSDPDTYPQKNGGPEGNDNRVARICCILDTSFGFGVQSSGFGVLSLMPAFYTIPAAFLPEASVSGQNALLNNQSMQ